MLFLGLIVAVKMTSNSSPNKPNCNSGKKIAVPERVYLLISLLSFFFICDYYLISEEEGVREEIINQLMMVSEDLSAGQK